MYYVDKSAELGFTRYLKEKNYYKSADIISVVWVRNRERYATSVFNM